MGLKKLVEFVNWWNDGFSTEEYIEYVSDTLVDSHAEAVGRSFKSKYIAEVPRTHLGISELGKPAVLTALKKLGVKERVSARSLYTFHYGDWFESLVLSLMKLHGLDVRHEQNRVRFLSCEGHIDAVVEGSLIEIKSLSERNFTRFTKEPTDAVYGYATQLACYSYAMNLSGYWLCLNKQADKKNPQLALVPLTEGTYEGCVERALDLVQALEAINDIESLVDHLEPPEGIPEVYQKKETGNLLIPESMRYSEHAHLFYETGIYPNGYNKPTEYIIKYRTPVEIIERFRQCYGDVR